MLAGLIYVGWVPFVWVDLSILASKNNIVHTENVGWYLSSFHDFHITRETYLLSLAKYTNIYT